MGNGTVMGAASGGSKPSFFGYTSNVAFSSVTFTQAPVDGGAFNFYSLDNVSYRQATQLDSPGGGVPEPASWALMVLGFGGLGGVLRQRRRLIAV